MNKYTIGTVLGTALLSLAKNNTKGSNVKIKPVCSIQAYISCRVDLTLILTELFHPRYKNLVTLTEKVWDNLVKTKIEVIQPSEQQSSEQQSSEQQVMGIPTYTYTLENGEKYKIRWADLLMTLQYAIGSRIEELVHTNPDFKYPEGWDENIHSWYIDTDMMYMWSDDLEDYEEFVNDEKAYFYFQLNMSQLIEEPPFPDEDTVSAKLDQLFGEIWDQVWDASFNTIKEEFFVTRMVADFGWNYERDVSVEKYLAIEQDGEWVQYSQPKRDITKLRKK